MDENVLNRNSPVLNRGEMKSLADSQKATVTIPVAVAPIEVQIALASVLVEVGHIAVAIQVHPDGTV